MVSADICEAGIIVFMKKTLWIIATALWLWTASDSRGGVFRWHEDRMWLDVQNAPIQEVLRKFRDAGVRVEVDPDIRHWISGRYDGMPIDRFFNEELKQYGYVLMWDKLPGPDGDIKRLESIQLFMPGRRDRMQLMERRAVYSVARSPLGGPPYVADEILVAVRPGTRAEDFFRLIEQIGGTLAEAIPELGVFRVILPEGSHVTELVAQLEGRDMLATVEPNYIVPAPDPARPEGGGFRGATDMPDAWPAGGTRIAVMDSGLSAAYAPEGLVAASYNAVDPESGITDPAGHGTQMALIAGGLIDPAGIESGTAAGEVSLVAVRAFDENGNASTYGLMSGIRYAIEQGARVINMSWGTPVDSDFLRAAVRYAYANDLVLVASAGNEPTGRPVYPAAYPEVLAVAAADGSGRPWVQSNFGDFINLSAPGFASFPVGYLGPPGTYAGSSTAASFCSRVVGVYLSRNPDARREHAFTALADALSPPVRSDDRRYGRGALDQSAVERMLHP